MRQSNPHSFDNFCQLTIKKRKSRNFFSLFLNRSPIVPPSCDQHRRLVANPPPNGHHAKRALPPRRSCRVRQSCHLLTIKENETRARAARGHFSRTIFTPPTPERGEWGRFVRVIVSNKKKQSHRGLLLRLSGKRDSSPRCARTILANLYLHPQPLEGATWGRFVRAIVCASTK